MTKTPKKEILCYGSVQWKTHCQEWYETKSRNARPRALALRKLGFKVFCESMGVQVTGRIDGTVRLMDMTLVTIIGDMKKLPKARMFDGVTGKS